MPNPVMKSLTIGGTTYDTVGEASVTQVVSSGTKIATVSIDGASTDLYAPSGSTVEPATATPIVDGTAAVGTSTKYAREDHVHPTDTSRQAALVSGTNIRTVDGQTLLSSGDVIVTKLQSSSFNVVDKRSKIETSQSTMTLLAENTGLSPTVSSSIVLNHSGITIDKLVAPTTDTMPATKKYVDDSIPAISTTTCTLGTSGWTSDAITVTATGVTSSNNVIVAPAPTSVTDYAAAGIVCTAQGSGTLTFTRTSANTNSITVNVLILG